MKGDGDRDSNLKHVAWPNIFEPIRSTILELQERFSGVEFTGSALLAFWRVWTVQVWNVIIADISEPKSNG